MSVRRNPLNVVSTPLAGVRILEPDVFRDGRGYFLESWNRARYREVGIDAEFVQDNVSCSHRGVLRGLHYQNPVPQGKLVSVLHGAVWDVAVDLRVGSPTFGQWRGVELSARNARQLYVPEGFAHGFVVLGEGALVSYKCTAHYAPENERSLRWDDPDVGIDWPAAEPVVSTKDREAPLLRDTPAEHLFGVERQAESIG